MLLSSAAVIKAAVNKRVCVYFCDHYNAPVMNVMLCSVFLIIMLRCHHHVTTDTRSGHSWRPSHPMMVSSWRRQTGTKSKPAHVLTFLTISLLLGVHLLK